MLHGNTIFPKIVYHWWVYQCFIDLFLFSIFVDISLVNLIFQFAQQTFDTHGMGFASQATREYARGTPPEWLHMQVGSGFERTT